ncbi:MAG: GNAT family N-acetyltransferase [Pseudomonadota bacterium]
MGVTVAPIAADQLSVHLPALARLRIEVFRAFPYLYDGDMAYEERYLETYAAAPNALVVGAWDGPELVGAATAAPMEDHAAEFAAPFADRGYDLADILYCGESVLLSRYRGQGIGNAFFDARESHGRALERRFSAFCGVIRPEDHPARPTDYRPLDAFWRKRGYEKVAGLIAHFPWRDIGDRGESSKPMQFWLRSLMTESEAGSGPEETK